MKKHSATAPAQAAADADIDAKLATMVAQLVEERSTEFEEKLKYWKGEVDLGMAQQFQALNQSLLGQLSQIQNDIDTQHASHITEITRLQNIKQDQVMFDKAGVLRISRLEDKMAQLKLN